MTTIRKLAPDLRERVLSAALERLEDRDLWTLAEVTDQETAAVERGDGGPVDLWQFAGAARDREALERFATVLEDLRPDEGFGV